MASANPGHAQQVDKEKKTESALETEVAAQPAKDDKASLEDTPDLAFGAFQRGHYLTAFELALPRAQIGDPAAQTLIGELYERGLGVKRDQRESTKWFKIAADNGSREARFSYALKLLEGKYVEKDKKKAAKLMKQAADAGHSVAQFNYGQVLIEERPTTRGLSMALEYFEKAAAGGVADAYFAMAQIETRGVGLMEPDLAKARNLLIKAARNGVDNAQIELAIWLANGRGGNQDMKAARAWFKLSADKGNVIAQNRLARMLMLGMGGDVDLVEAAKWYVLARRRGHKDSKLDEFFKSLDPKIRKEALDKANQWPSG